MQDYEKLGVFYLGRETASAKPLLYNSKDLVTHAVCVGMTGSGKTGLCIDLLEEAAIDGVPAIVIDPKGDIANLLLQFPELRAEDFKPWLDPEEAQRQNVTLDQLAQSQADLWRAGLAKWDQEPGRIQRLKESADFAVYTPGSNAGLPMSLLKSFAAPGAAALDDRELMRDRVSGTATAVLSLLGIAAEPMKSREHILLANIFDKTWAEGRSLTIEELIGAIQQPPMQRVGVVDLESFYPSKERFELAMSLNNLLASPGFESWLEGEPLDIGRLLYTTAGKPRVSILSIAHLNDTERMFFVTLVLNELIGWMRAQSGTSSLRAIFYMDEIFGYFPPVANPPSKRPLLTLLKQARAFGIGAVLATQNPVDLDYKGLANAGTWFIGRLQTERDKMRLIDGLEGALSESGASFDRAEMERILSGLGKRMFLMNNVHEKGPVIFETRWALSYLRGPLTRAQIRTLMQSRKTATPPAPQPTPTASAPASAPARSAVASARPVVPPEVPQAWLPARAHAAAGIAWHPAILGAAQVRFIDTKAKVDFVKDAVFLTPIHDDALPVEWEQCIEIAFDPNALERGPAPGTYASLPAVALKPKSYAAWQKDLVSWIFGHQSIDIYSSATLRMTSQPGESERDFRLRLQQGLREQRDALVDRLRTKYAPKIATLQDRLMRAQQAVERERQEAQSQTMTAALDIGASVFGAMFGRRKFTTAAKSAMRGVGRRSQQSGDIQRAGETLEAVAGQLDQLEQQFHEEVAAVQSRLDARNEPLDTVGIKPKKANIQVRLLTLAWVPYTSEGKPAWE
ncbi:MAG: hypothetical protein SGI92_29425 [Bryobacteraceae bacterium]|nr:hypothetical protein [Bryobacteraceae bacterium]